MKKIFNGNMKEQVEVLRRFEEKMEKRNKIERIQVILD